MARQTPQNTADKRITPEFAAQAGKGRPKGVQNVMTRQVKEMILAALDKAGGVDYLADQAKKTPAAFLSLVGKVLPMQVTGEDGGAIRVETVVRRVVDPEATR